MHKTSQRVSQHLTVKVAIAIASPHPSAISARAVIDFLIDRFQAPFTPVDTGVVKTSRGKAKTGG